MLASSFYIARVDSTSVGIVAALWDISAFCIFASVNCAWIFVITSKDMLAFSIHAFIKSASVRIIAVNRSVDTALS
jgi:hypothetical protein